MANLSNLKAFDDEFKQCLKEMNSLQRAIEVIVTRPTTEEERLSVLIGAVRHLTNAVSYLVHNNR